jgi:hypothetical protein
VHHDPIKLVGIGEPTAAQLQELQLEKNGALGFTSGDVLGVKAPTGKRKSAQGIYRSFNPYPWFMFIAQYVVL